MLKDWCLWTVVLEKTLESPLNIKEVKSVNLKGNWHWTFIGRTNSEAEAPMLWPPDAKSQIIGKVPYLEKIEGKKEDNRRQDNRMASSTEWTWVWATPGDGEIQGNLACCSLWGHKEWDKTEWLKNNNCIQMGTSLLFHFAFHFSSFISYL